MTTQTAPTDFLVDHVQICTPEELRDLPELQGQIAKRAKELFEARGGARGYESRDWSQAERELLRPVEFTVIEYEDEVRVRAGVLGFEADELKLALEARRAIVRGRKCRDPELGNKIFYVEWSPNEIFTYIELPVEVIPGKAVCTLRSGVLELIAPKK